jgi:hypothetical protein
MNHRSHCWLLALLLGLLWTQAACAWGNVGHRITGLIAESLLSTQAREQVRQLLGEETLAVAATDMDTQRGALTQRWTESDRWHYDNQPVCQQQTAYCADGQCATRQIERFKKILADRQASRSERALALRIVVHLLGDIHQPLHMADNEDRGGNNLFVRLYAGSERYRLHEVFDGVLIKQLQGGLSIKHYAASLQQRYGNQLRGWQSGTLNDWAAQTHVLAVQQTYGQLPGFVCQHHDETTVTLPDSYVQPARAYLPEQLAKAGARIAQVLNSILK